MRPTGSGSSRSDAIKKFFAEWGRDLLFAFALALFLRATAVEAKVVPSGSMLPTVEIGDRLIVEKLTYHFREPKRGEIITFIPPVPSETDFVKRVIAVPGETVEIRNGQVYIDGQPLAEPYLNEPPTYRYGPVTVPEGRLLVLGDNRNESWDGHDWGLLDIDSVKGRVILRYWPLDRVGTL